MLLDTYCCNTSQLELGIKPDKPASEASTHDMFPMSKDIKSLLEIVPLVHILHIADVGIGDIVVTVGNAVVVG